MFGYKFEIWKYDSARCQEAERHLQDMADRGYEFTGVKSYMWPFVVYKKHERPVCKKYSVSILPGDDETLTALCRESGWEILGDSIFGMTVFAADDPDATPLFTDEESRLEMWREMFKDEKRDKGWGLLLLAGALVWVIYSAIKYGEITLSSFLPLVVIIMTGMLWASSALVQDRVIKGQYKCITEGTEYVTPGWIRLFYRLKFPVITLCCISILFIDRLPLFMDGMIWPLFTMILNLGLFAAGAVLYGNNIYPRLGKFLMMLAVWLELAMGHFARSWDNVWSRYF